RDFAVDAVNPPTLYIGLSHGLAAYTAAPPPAITPTPTAAPIAQTPAGSGQTFTFNQTGHTVAGIWLDFLRSHGDVDNLGYPRTEVITAQVNANQAVQYFQRLV